ncbi:MAG: nucleoside triphosphate pyrophosphohydrolase [Bacteroidales bacterium]|nr:nucleoside triphosphate pyrophosphohydrolase [Bacteroidales bacterium]
MESKASAEFERLSTILDTLRQRCPWDRAQTLRSLRYLTVEEVYELSEAILAENPADMCKELGDIAMHIYFYAKIAEDEGLFSMADVLRSVCDKLVARHPFIYGHEQAGAQTWEQLKMREGRRSVLQGVPASLPPLVKAVRMQEKAAGVGYPLPEELPQLPADADEEQLGDYMLALVSWARRRGLNADDALSRANQRLAESVHQWEEQQNQ